MEAEVGLVGMGRRVEGEARLVGMGFSFFTVKALKGKSKQ